MALLPVALLRSVLVFPGDAGDTVYANLRALRQDVNPEGADVHLLRFVGDLADRTGVVPDVALVRTHYAGLTAQGDAHGYACDLRLTEVETAGVPLLAVTEFRYQLDQFRETVLSDGIGVLLQQASAIVTTGLTQPDPKTKKPLTYKGSADALKFLQGGLGALSGQFRAGDIEGTMRDLADAFTRYQQRVGAPSTGVPLGYDQIDNAHGGLRRGDLALLLGYTSHMKSTLLWNIVYHAAIWYGKNCAVVSMEMGAKDLQDTFVVMHCSHRKWEAQFGAMTTITADRFAKGQLTAHEETLVRAAIDDLTVNPDYGQILYKEPDSDQTVGQIKAWAEQHDQSTCALDLLAVDYLGLVNPSSGGASLKESAIANLAMREAKQAAMTFRQGKGIPILSPIQSNREGYKAAVKASGRYELTALAWAPEGEKSADLVYSVYLSETLRATHQLLVCNLKARGRRLIVDPITLMADQDLRVVEDFDPGNVRHQMVPGL